MLHAIHLLPAPPLPFSHIGTRARAVIGRITKQQTPTITVTRCADNPETLHVLHAGVNDFIKWTGQIPTTIYVSKHHYEAMHAWGFECYYAAFETQSGCHPVRIQSCNVLDDTAICVGPLAQNCPGGIECRNCGTCNPEGSSYCGKCRRTL